MKALGEVEYQGTTDFHEDDLSTDTESFMTDLKELGDVVAVDLTPEAWNALGQPRKLRIYAEVVEEAGFGGARQP